MKIVALTAIILASGVTLAGGLTQNLTVTVIGTILVIAAAVVQYVANLPFTMEFAEQDWERLGTEYRLCIPALRHRIGHGASAQIYEWQRDSYEIVQCDVMENADGSLMIHSTLPFRGKVVLK